MSEAPLEDYEYLALDARKGEQTRLLCLARGSHDETISGKLLPFSLEDPNLPAFTALSYTWGSMTKDAAILVDSAHLPVTINLLAALKHLRKANEDRWVWIDAICINQADDGEKSLQVPNIHNVFHAAQSCLAWLGPPAGNSEAGMRTIRRAEFPLTHEERIGFGGDWWPDPFAVLDILDRKYWKRMWILQELSWAKEIYFACGDIEVSFKHFEMMKGLHAICAPQGSGGFGAFTLSLIARLKTMLTEPHQFDNRKMLSLLDLLTLKVGFEATDPRDHVYALLNLLPRSEWPSTPNYSKGVVEVFADVAIHEIQAKRSLEFLRLCRSNALVVPVPVGLNTYTPEEFTTDNHGQLNAVLPSWVPNWSQLIARPSLNNFAKFNGTDNNLYASGYGIPFSAQVLGVPGAPLLTTNAIIYDSISACSPLLVPRFHEIDKVAVDNIKLLAFRNEDKRTKYIDGTLTREEALWRTLMLDCDVYLHRPEPFDVFNFADRIQKSQKLTAHEDASLNDRKFFVTNIGMFGIGPESCNSGDLVVIIPGCSVPMVLRNSGSNAMYEVIGDSCR